MRNPHGYVGNCVQKVPGKIKIHFDFPVWKTLISLSFLEGVCKASCPISGFQRFFMFTPIFVEVIRFDDCAICFSIIGWNHDIDLDSTSWLW